MNNLSFDDVIELLNVVPEILIIALFYSRIFQRKYTGAMKYIIAYSFAYVLLGSITLYVSQPQIQIISTFVIMLMLSLTLYIGSKTIKLFASVYYIVIVLISELMFAGLLSLMGYGAPADLLNSGTGRFIGMIGTKIFDFWLIVYSCRIYKNKVRSLPFKYWILILLMPLLSAIMLDLIFPKIGSNESVMLFFVITVIGLLYLNFSVFNYFESYDNQIKLAALEKILERENENYRTLTASYSEIREIKHDLKNQVELLNDLINRGDYKAAQNHMNKLYCMTENATSVCYTGNAAVDSIVNMKGVLAKCESITYITKINADNISQDTVGLCRILGNALDNAIEACRRITDGDRIIYLTIRRFEGKLLIEITNTSLDVDVSDLTTSKNDKMIHGIGLKSIKKTVTDMNGYVSIDYEKGYFTIKIVLND